MSTFTVETDCGTTRQFDSRREAEEGKETHESLCDECDPENVRIVPGNADPSANNPSETDDSKTDDSEATDSATDGADESVTDGGSKPDAEAASDPVPADAHRDLPPELPESVQTDPLDVVPGYVVDVVDGQPTINKRGYAVIANHFDIVVQSEPITTAGETDHEYAEFRTRAWKKEDGPEAAYTGHGTARVSESRSAIANNLNEMAETRAMKRATTWASGIGILACEEMTEYVEGDEYASEGA
jgi:hypothetical protein